MDKIGKCEIAQIDKAEVDPRQKRAGTRGVPRVFGKVAKSCQKLQNFAKLAQNIAKLIQNVAKLMQKIAKFCRPLQIIKIGHREHRELRDIVH